jgi:hypothetical protein
MPFPFNLYSSRCISSNAEGYPNGKEAVLKTAGAKALAGSSPVPSATSWRLNKKDQLVRPRPNYPAAGARGASTIISLGPRLSSRMS